MTEIAIASPLQPFLGLSGQGLNGGQLYIGVAGEDPQTYPQPVYWDAEATLPATQPLELLGGYVVNNGTPAQVFTAPTYSMRLCDRFGSQVYYFPELPYEAPAFAPQIGPLVRGPSKKTARTREDAIAMATDLTDIVGYAQSSGCTGGNATAVTVGGVTTYTIFDATNASGSASDEGSLPWAINQAVMNGGGIVLGSVDGTFDVDPDEPIVIQPPNPAVTTALNITIAFPGRNWRLLGDNGVPNGKISMLGANWIIKYLDMPPVPSSNGGDGFSYGVSGFSPPASSPFTIATNVTGAGPYNFQLPTPPIRNTTPGVLVLANGVQIGSDDGVGQFGSASGLVYGTINLTTGAYSVTLNAAAASQIAIQITPAAPGALQQTINIGTATGSVQTLTGALSGGPFKTVTPDIVISANAPAYAWSDGLGGLWHGNGSGSTYAGLINYATGAGSFSAGGTFGSPVTITAAFASQSAPVGDGIHIVPAWSYNGVIYYSDRFAVVECSIARQGDGLLDVAASLLTPSSPPIRGSIIRPLHRFHDKGSTCGSDTSYALGTPPVLLLTVVDGVFDGVGSRSFRVGPLAFVHEINCLHILSPHYRPDGSVGDIYGIAVADSSAAVWSQSNLAMLGSPCTPNYAYGQAVGLPVGAFLDQGSVSVGAGAIGSPANTQYIPTLPYTITPNTIPTDPADQLAYFMAQYAQAGAQELSPFDDNQYVFVAQAAGDAAGLYADGYNVVFDPAGVSGVAGYRRRIADTVKGRKPASVPVQTQLTVPTGAVLVPDGSGDLYIPTGLLYPVQPSSGASAEVTNIFAAGNGTLMDGQVAYLQPANGGGMVAINTSGNIEAANGLILVGQEDIAAFRYDLDVLAWRQWTSPTPISKKYTPTTSNTVNCASTPSFGQVNYLLAGATLIVSGSVALRASAAGLLSFDMTLPLGTIAVTGAISGLASCPLAASPWSLGGSITGDVGDDSATVTVGLSDTSSHTFAFHFEALLTP